MITPLGQMDYTVVFDVGETGYRQWRTPVFALVFVGIGIVFVITSRKYLIHSRFSIFRITFSLLFVGFALLIFCLSFLFSFTDYQTLVSALRDGRCQIVEGRVTDFNPMPEAGHHYESFVVNGHRFAYSDYDTTAGFNNTSSHGGPIYNGAYVRVHYSGNEIARLELAR